MAYLPVETVIRNQQTKYYAVLSAADQASDAAGLVEFMLQALLAAMQEVVLASPIMTRWHQVGIKSPLS